MICIHVRICIVLRRGTIELTSEKYVAHCNAMNTHERERERERNYLKSQLLTLCALVTVQLTCENFLVRIFEMFNFLVDFLRCVAQCNTTNTRERESARARLSARARERERER